MSLLAIIKNGIVDENPTTRLVLGMCPTLAVTTSAINGIGMGVSTLAVLMGSNIVISLLRSVIPDKVRIPSYIVVIAGFVTIVQMTIKAFAPSVDQALGIFIPLIVVNCIILARAEAFASKNGVLASAADGLGMGIGFTIMLLIIGGAREILGNGSIFGIALYGQTASPALMMILPPGGFLAFGVLIGIVNMLSEKKITQIGCDSCGAPCKRNAENRG
ncbi:MAG TPA: electron transport complex subunit E [Spirochaetota bacterium]|nr:electron transport complex subunit E [Spirochaetota bacterium]HNT09928.1 electron transport complex subunit E [Spirochaetota bacterium]HNV45863.1 electron transport complex subunit E [Spirochaetota bacterium]HOS40864.1 electron transport complex subunit E [Spirochaetota bacterium]HPI21759.1 electron transport complex subunit E [Spirochaetota bacterium]